MEVEKFVGGEEELQKKKVMGTDKVGFALCGGPTDEVEESTDLYLHGGAPPAAHTATSPPPPPPPTSTSLLSQPAAAAFAAPPSPIPAIFKSPGMAAAATAGATFRFPFTTAQWQELERQAMIYKYMMAAVPIPPDLLLPAKPSFCDSSAAALGRSAGSTTFHLRFTNTVDPEPGRCRRTDGKKWRCSRDVAPDQKYCERHMHRGRPRSRKHVEAQAQAQSLEAPSPAKSKARTVISSSNTTTATTTTTSSRNPPLHTLPAAQSSFLAAKNPFFAEVEEQPRYVDWMNGAGSGSGHVWPLMEQDAGARMRPCYDQDGLNLNFSGFGGHEQSSQYIFFNSDLSMEDPLHKEPPLHFIDAWSMSTGEPSAVSDAGAEADKFPIMSSSLTLSMPSCEVDEQAVRMGLGVPESDNGATHRSLGWDNSPLPLLGGPLGEVLQSTTSASSNTLSPHSCGSLNLMVEPSVDGCTTTTTGRDSPSGVLHRTLASLSDSSGCSSPTFAACQFAFLS